LDGVDDILYEVTCFCGLNGEVYPFRKREGFIGSAESAKLKFSGVFIDVGLIGQLCRHCCPVYEEIVSVVKEVWFLFQINIY
jgi:hypothetical protein